MASRATTLVDTNVLSDVLNSDPRWADWSADRLAEAFDDGPVVINPIIYAELAPSFTTVELLDSAVPADRLTREPLPYQAGFLAGHVHLRYRRAGGTKRSPLPDFYIGAHAAVRGYRLLTRDVARYRTYFPRLDMVVP
ncbi:DNA-binding protein [Pseudonocardia sulfidoxydans NBRC 16205]|uniref:DNA-binding protein n=1 Tax=Pseudonocardia sulfidoxydans NBRC 16205 TaxID=1223511 RepID=A0A511DJL3_9PSEU|nr:type II toxin-antitoxin system VapC family toxin [Pseudonocardia sulfidoxydans]GEL24996.1 DNA-binding protein [Pseudonocardia sulfidoxydans NBRC 16205]